MHTPLHWWVTPSAAVWRLRAWKLHLSPLPLVPNQLMRKPGVRSFCVSGDSNRASRCLHATTCTHSPALPTKKIVSLPSLLSHFQTSLGGTLLSPGSLVLWVSNLFIPTWCGCDIIIPNTGPKFWRGIHLVTAGQPQQLEFYEDTLHPLQQK